MPQKEKGCTRSLKKTNAKVIPYNTIKALQGKLQSLYYL